VVCEQLARDTGASLADWQDGTGNDTTIEKVVMEANRLMDDDVKATGLKELQGQIWAEGYAAGELKSHVFDDVKPALESWRKAGIDIRIFSSGSIGAQKVFFKNTEYGDLCRFISDHYDTTSGSKKEADSYKAILSDCGAKPHEVTFFSDIVEELDAAMEVGMSTILVRRPGNKQVAEDHGHPTIESFHQVSTGTPAT